MPLGQYRILMATKGCRYMKAVTSGTYRRTCLHLWIGIKITIQSALFGPCRNIKRERSKFPYRGTIVMVDLNDNLLGFH